jgi:hypothetical protein
VVVPSFETNRRLFENRNTPLPTPTWHIALYQHQIKVDLASPSTNHQQRSLHLVGQALTSYTCTIRAILTDIGKLFAWSLDTFISVCLENCLCSSLVYKTIQNDQTSMSVAFSIFAMRCCSELHHQSIALVIIETLRKATALKVPIQTVRKL